MAIYKEQDIEYILNRDLSAQIGGTIDAGAVCPWNEDTLRIPKGTVLGQDSVTKRLSVIRSSVLDGSAAASQKVVPVADTTPFKVGDVVTLKSATLTEDITIASIQVGVSITAASNLANSYSIGDYAYVKGANGSDSAKFILDEAVLLRNAVGVAENTPASITVAALIIEGRITKITAREKAQLLAEGGYKFVEVE